MRFICRVKGIGCKNTTNSELGGTFEVLGGTFKHRESHALRHPSDEVPPSKETVVAGGIGVL